MSSKFVSAGTLKGNAEGQAVSPSSSTKPLNSSFTSSSKPTAQKSIKSGNPPPKPSSGIVHGAPPTSTSHLPATIPSTTSGTTKPLPEAWTRVQSQLDADRARRAATSTTSLQPGGEESSLYAILQANKAAKQAAFEEANKIRNQFRALDEDELDFLDEVREGERRKEERERRDVEEGLRVFRKGRGAKGTIADEEEGKEDGNEVVEEFGFGGGGGRKRKKAPGRIAGVVKRRETKDGEKESAVKDAEVPESKSSQQAVPSNGHTAGLSKTAEPTAATIKSAGLVSYDSDDDSD